MSLSPQDPSATIGEGTVLGPDVSVDRDVIIGKGCRLKNCALMRGVVVSDFSWIDSSILGWQSSIGKWVSPRLLSPASYLELAT